MYVNTYIYMTSMVTNMVWNTSHGVFTYGPVRYSPKWTVRGPVGPSVKRKVYVSLMFHWSVLIVTVRACAPLLLYSRSHNQNLSPVSTDSDWTARPWSVSTSTGCVKVTPLLCHQRTLVLCAQFVLHEWHCERMGCESANTAQCFTTRLFYKDQQFYIYAFIRRFYPKRFTEHSVYTFIVSMCVPWELNPPPLCC